MTWKTKMASFYFCRTTVIISLKNTLFIISYHTATYIFFSMVEFLHS
jgi:hypothetical protein